MAFTKNIKTIVVAAGNSYSTTPGIGSIDMLYTGTTAGCTFTGNVTGSVPVELPPSISYTLEYNMNGLPVITITNGGNGPCNVVEKQ